MGFFAGFSQDIYAPVEWLGAETMALTIVGFIVGQFEERFLSLNLGTKVGVLGMGFIIGDVIYFLAIGEIKTRFVSFF
jgi:rod shape-determining protein MreD